MPLKLLVVMHAAEIGLRGLFEEKAVEPLSAPRRIGSFDSTTRAPPGSRDPGPESRLLTGASGQTSLVTWATPLDRSLLFNTSPCNLTDCRYACTVVSRRLALRAACWLNSSRFRRRKLAMTPRSIRWW